MTQHSGGWEFCNCPKYLKFIPFLLSLAIASSFSVHAQPKLAEEKGSEMKPSVEQTGGALVVTEIQPAQ